MPRLSLLVSTLVTASVTAQSAHLRPPILLPGTATIAGAADVQQGAALAAGSTSTLMVFEDKRAGDLDLFGVRLDPTGVPLDSVPFPIAKDPGDQTDAQVCFNGTDWLVVYSNQVDPGTGYFAYQVAARRVSAQGVVRDATPIPLFRDDSGIAFSVASDDQNWAVVFTGFSGNNSDAACRRIAANGAILDPVPVVIVPGAVNVYTDIAVTFVGGNYVFTWSDNNGLEGQRFTPNLQPLDPAPVLLGAEAPQMASSGTSLYLTWGRQNAQFVVEVVGQRYGANLQPIDPSPTVLATASGNDQPTNPDVVFDGSQWIVAWQHFGTQNQRAARVTLAGSVLDPGGVSVPDGSPNYLYGPALGALAGGGAVLAWHDIRFRANEVFATPFFANAGVGSERDFSVGAEALSAPRVSGGPQQMLLTFKGQTAATSRVLAQRTDAFGTPLDAEPIPVASASHVDLSAGGAAWNGSLYLIVWSDVTTGRVLARRMRADATFVDAAPIDVMPGFAADVAALGDTFLVTGLRAPTNPQFVSSFAARVRGSDGVVLDSPALVLAGTYATRARAVTLGTRFLVATESHFTHNSNQASVQANFVDVSGVVTPTVTVGTGNIQDWGSIDVAASDASALFVWQSGSNWTNTDLFARRMLLDGSLPAPQLGLTAADPDGQSRACVTWTGDEFVVAYQTLQNNGWFYDLEPDVYAVRVRADGVLRDGNGFALFAGEDYEQRPDAASIGFGRALFACARYVDDGYAAFRIDTRTLWPVGVDTYGIGTAGCDGVQHMFTSGAPTLVNPGFAALCDHVPAATPGVLLLGPTPDVIGTLFPSLGLRVHVGLAGTLITLPMIALGNGLGRAPLPLPGNPTLRNARLYLQSAWPWGTACSLPPLGLSASDGLELVLQ
ncbi:MAG: hypothetical protein R3F56_18590 [Planctomycetota bacterium]